MVFKKLLWCVVWEGGLCGCLTQLSVREHWFWLIKLVIFPEIFWFPDLFEQSQLCVVIRNIVRWCCHHWHEYGIDCLVLKGCRGYLGRNCPCFSNHSPLLQTKHRVIWFLTHCTYYLWSCLNNAMAATCSVLHFWLTNLWNLLVTQCMCRLHLRITPLNVEHEVCYVSVLSECIE